MAEDYKNILRTRIQQKYDSVDAWQASTLPLLHGEIAFDETGRFKVGRPLRIGDITISQPTWSQLDYSGTYALNKTYFPDILNATQVGMLVQITPDPNPAQDAPTPPSPGLYILEGFTNNNIDNPIWTKIATGEDLAGKIAEIESRLDTIDEVIPLLQAEDEALANRIEGVESGLASLVSEQENQSAQISAIEGNIQSTIQSSLQAIESSISAIQSSIGTVKTENGQVVDLQSQIDAIDSDLQEQISEINAKIGTVPNGSTVEGQISAINDEIGTLQGSELEAYTNLSSSNTIKSKIVAINEKADTAALKSDTAISKVTGVIDDNNKIRKSALPSYVDDVIEGFVGFEYKAGDPEVTYSELEDISIPVKPATGQSPTIQRFFTRIDTSEASSIHTYETTSSYGVVCKEDDNEYDATINVTGLKINSNITNATVDTSKRIKVLEDAIYVDVHTNKTYRWSGSQFVIIASDLALGDNEASAFAGNRGVDLENAVFGDGTTEAPGLVNEVSELANKVEQLEQATENVDDYATKEELLTATAPIAESVATLQTDLLAVNTSLSEKIGTVPSGDNLQAEIEALQDLIGDLENDTIEGNTVVSSLASLKHLIDGVNADISLINSTIGVLTSDVNGNTIAEKLVTLKTALDNVQSNLGALIAQNATDISTLSEKEASDIENLSALIATLSDTISTITLDTSDLEARITTNASNIAANVASISEIQGKLEDSNNQVPDGETVQGEINGLSAGLTALQNELETSVSDIEAAEEVLATAISTKVDYSDTIVLQCGGASA